MGLMQDIIGKLIAYGYMLFGAFYLFGLDQYYTNKYIDYFWQHRLAIFLISMFLLIMTYRGGGVLGFIRRLIK